MSRIILDDSANLAKVQSEGSENKDAYISLASSSVANASPSKLPLHMIYAA